MIKNNFHQNMKMILINNFYQQPISIGTKVVTFFVLLNVFLNIEMFWDVEVLKTLWQKAHVTLWAVHLKITKLFFHLVKFDCQFHLCCLLKYFNNDLILFSNIDKPIIKEKEFGNWQVHKISHIAFDFHICVINLLLIFFFCFSFLEPKKITS